MKHETQLASDGGVPVDYDMLNRWNALISELNGRPLVGTPGIRDVDHPCEEYDGKGYDGRGRCDSDGHYECVNCSRLSADAPRFIEHGAAGRLDRIRLILRNQKRRR